MAILVGCEESGILTKAFRDRGYEAYSCDLKPTRGLTEYHFQEDVMTVVPSARWDLIILHPDCTAMALSGNTWYGQGKPKYHERQAAVDWTLNLWRLAKQFSHRVALENPRSVIFQYMWNVQYVQPWQFGHGEVKKTGFALHNLPHLIPTRIVTGRKPRVHEMGQRASRKQDRSETYLGIAQAIAYQWGKLVESTAQVVK